MQSTNQTGATQSKAIFSQELVKGMAENDDDSSYVMI